MQVNSLFATFFAFLSLVAPLATQAFTITTPSNLTTGNNDISVTREAADPAGPLTLLIVRNSSTATIAQGVNASASGIPIVVTIPANISGDGWYILAIDSSDAPVGQSQVFSVTDTSKPSSGAGMAGTIVGGVIAGVAGVSLIVLLAFLRTRRRRQQSPGLTFALEAGFPQPRPSSVSSEPDSASQSLEIDKMQWEQQLEAQFARARAMTPDMQRSASLSRHPSPMPLAPLRAVTRN
jgi:hypothetical protein